MFFKNILLNINIKQKPQKRRRLLSNKASLLPVLSAFLEKYDRIITDTDSLDFNPKKNDIFGLLEEWRLVFDSISAIASMKIEELIRHLAVDLDVDTLVEALKKTVPGSIPEKDIVDRLQKIFRRKNCNGLKGEIDLNRACSYAFKLAQYPELSLLLQKIIAEIIFKKEDCPDLWERRVAIEKALSDFRKKALIRKVSQTYSLFCWLESFSDRLGTESYLWPVRQLLMGMMVNPDIKPTFVEMLKMWQKSARYPELQYSLKQAMLDEVATVLNHKVIPPWFFSILKNPETCPYFLFSAVVEKIKDLIIFLRFEEDPVCFASEIEVKETPVIILEKSHFWEDFFLALSAKERNIMAKISGFSLKDCILAFLP